MTTTPTIEHLESLEVTCIESASSYTSLTEWQRARPELFKKAEFYGWLYTCCRHMKDAPAFTGKPDVIECVKSARSYKITGMWRINEPALYQHANNSGWLPECAVHIMDDKQLPSSAVFSSLPELYASRQPFILTYEALRLLRQHVIATAKTSKSFLTWQSKRRYQFLCARHYGWITDVENVFGGNLKNDKPDILACMDTAKQYDSIEQWMMSEPEHYHIAQKKRWLFYCFKHIDADAPCDRHVYFGANTCKYTLPAHSPNLEQRLLGKAGARNGIDSMQTKAKESGVSSAVVKKRAKPVKKQAQSVIKPKNDNTGAPSGNQAVSETNTPRPYSAPLPRISLLAPGSKQLSSVPPAKIAEFVLTRHGDSNTVTLTVSCSSDDYFQLSVTLKYSKGYAPVWFPVPFPSDTFPDTLPPAGDVRTPFLSALDRMSKEGNFIVSSVNVYDEAITGLCSR